MKLPAHRQHAYREVEAPPLPVTEAIAASCDCFFYEAARRAIIRCGAKGFQLPPEKYEQWRNIEMEFNPERMRIK